MASFYGKDSINLGTISQYSFGVVFRLNSAPTGMTHKTLASFYSAGAHIRLVYNQSKFYFEHYDGTFTNTSAKWDPGAGDLGKDFALAGVWKDNSLQLYVQGVAKGAADTASISLAMSSVDFAIGSHPSTGVERADNVTIWGVAFSNVGSTAAQVLSWYNSCATGTQTIVAAWPTDLLRWSAYEARELPTTWTATTGSHNLTDQGSGGDINVIIKNSLSWGSVPDNATIEDPALTPYVQAITSDGSDSTNYYRAAVGAGFQGHATTFSWAAILRIRDTSGPSGGIIYGYTNTTSSSDSFFFRHQTSGTPALVATLYAGAAIFSVESSELSEAEGDLDKIHTLVATLEVEDGTNKVLRFYHNGLEAGNIRVNATFTPSGSLRHSLLNGGSGGGGCPHAELLGAFTSNVTLTPTQIKTWHDAIVADPETIPALSGEQNRWVASDALGLPTTWEDATGSADLTKVGSPAVTDAFAAIVQEYDSVAAFRIPSTSNYFTTVNHSVGVGSTTMTAAVLLRSGPTPHVNETVWGRGHTSESSGWAFRRQASDGKYHAYVITDGGFTIVETPDASAKANKLLFLVFTWDGTTMHCYRQGTVVGAGTANSTYQSPTSSAYLHVGRTPTSTGWNKRDSIVGMAFKNGTAMTSGEIATWYTNVVAAGDMVAPPTTVLDEWWKASSNTAVGHWNGEINGASTKIDKVGTPVLTYHRVIFAT